MFTVSFDEDKISGQKVTGQVLDMGDGMVFAVSIRGWLTVKKSEETPHVKCRDAGHPEADGM